VKAKCFRTYFTVRLTACRFLSLGPQGHNLNDILQQDRILLFVGIR
jgi:hypothetical protein